MSTNSQLRSGFITPDGKVFTTAAEARDYLRAPMVAAALKQISGGDKNLATFLQENEDEIMKAFEVGTVSRVTKSEKKKLEKALEHLLTIPDGKLKFLQDNHAAIAESFRWPSVKRMNDEQKAAETLAQLTKLADENAAKWIVANAKLIMSAYEAGQEKRLPNPKAMEALAAARAVRAANKANSAEQAAAAVTAGQAATESAAA